MVPLFVIVVPETAEEPDSVIVPLFSIAPDDIAPAAKFTLPLFSIASVTVTFCPSLSKVEPLFTVSVLNTTGRTVSPATNLGFVPVDAVVAITTFVSFPGIEPTFQFDLSFQLSEVVPSQIYSAPGKFQ